MSGRLAFLVGGLALAFAGAAHAAPEPEEAIVERIDQAISAGYWQSSNRVNLAFAAKLGRDRKLGLFAIYCTDYKGEPLPSYLTGCKITAMVGMLTHPFEIDLAQVDPASIAVVEGTNPDQSGAKVTFTCRKGTSCIGNAAGEVPSYDLLVCKDQDSCAQLKLDFATLVGRAPPASPGAAPKPSTPSVPTTPAAPTTPAGPQTLASVLDRINGAIGRAVYFSDRVLIVSTGLRQSADGRLELQGHRCDGLSLASPRQQIDACRASNPVSADTSVLFRASDLERTSVRLEESQGTFRVLFLCRNKGPCVARPDKSAYFPGAWIACPDRNTCNRLMADFFALLDVTAPNAKAAPTAKTVPNTNLRGAPTRR